METIRKVADQINKNKGDDNAWVKEYYKQGHKQKASGEEIQATEIKEEDGEVKKADSPHQTSTTGIFNAVYGANIWAQFNISANAWSMFDKNAWDRSGWRVEKTRPSASNNGAVAEAGSIPDSIKGTYEQLSATPKTTAHVVEVSEIQNLLADTEDDAVGDVVDMRRLASRTHMRDLSAQLTRELDTTRGNQMVSLDEVVSSGAEVSNNSNYSDGDNDVYGIDRSANSWADSVVKENSGTLRVLTDDLIRNLRSDVNNNVGGLIGRRFWFTGTDTADEIAGLYQDQVRYGGPFDPDSRATVGINGVEAVSGEGGENAGLEVSSLYGYPLITSDQAPVQSAQSNSISKLFLLDIGDPRNMGNPRMGIDVLKPTTTYEAGLGTDNENPFLVDKLSGKIMVETVAELKCRRFDAQGKITDLKAS